ncbi:sensor histidine kinase [Rhizobium sp. LC145]|uniref:sensor histidine kinase n=1 Tax=Rhizobium sp. LC145 TaxID=1120688 RepID=UPI0009E4CF16|nr:sensor histidine kinase [Rhizobium sp. LC145]TKT69057.1 sensor histidine kinase [Rhizobiaceae bacterium LC148]
MAPYRRDAEYLRTLLAEHEVAVRQATGPDELAVRLTEAPGILVVTHEALNPAILNIIAEHLTNQPDWSEMPIIILLDRTARHPQIRAKLSATWPRSRQIYYQRPVAALELLSGVQSALLARLRQRDVRNHIEREVELRRELNHRVKNILASVTAIFGMTRRNVTSVDQLADDFSGRLTALSNVHSAVFDAGGETVDLADIIERTCLPYRSGGKDRIIAKGSSVHVGRDAGTTIALCLHELATNALKYGALSRPQGQVHLDWELLTDSEPVLTMRWIESGGPPVAQPSKPGYGTLYVRSALRGLFGSPPQIIFNSEGLRCIATGSFSRFR